MSVQRFSSASRSSLPSPKTVKMTKNSAINNQQHKNLLNNGKRRRKKVAQQQKKIEFNFIQWISSTQSIYTRESSDREYIKLPESARFKLSQEHRERKHSETTREKTKNEIMWTMNWRIYASRGTIVRLLKMFVEGHYHRYCVPIAWPCCAAFQDQQPLS